MTEHSSQTIVVIYERGHLAQLPRLMAEAGKGETLVLALDRELELALEAQGVPFISSKAYQSGNSDELVLSAEQWMKKLFDDPAWSFFRYRDVPFTEVFFSVLLVHVQRILYFADICANVVEKHPNARLVIPESLEHISATSGYLVGRDVAVPAEALRAIAGSKGLTVVVPALKYPENVRRSLAYAKFAAERAVFGWLLSFWNAGIAVLRRPMHPRIVVSDYWRNIAPVFAKMNGGEMVLLDRAQLLHIDFVTLWRFRMRFVHLENYASRRQKAARRKASHEIVQQWQKLSMSKEYFAHYSYRGISLAPLIRDALQDTVARGVELLGEIDATYRMLVVLKPDSILLRTSVSGQAHFAILAYVGRALGVPTVELQHGLEYLGPGSNSKRHTAEYVGVYGPIIQDEMVALGFPREKLPLIGSPRFDQYALHDDDAARMASGMTVLSIVPLATFGEFADSYMVEEYLRGVAEACAVQGTHVILKLRPGLRQEAMYRELIARLFTDVPHTVAMDEPLIKLFSQADMVVSCYSTAVLEALQCGKPTVLWSPMSFEMHALNDHFAKYRDADAVVIAQDAKELKDTLAELTQDPSRFERMEARVAEFMRQAYTFDGKASERIVELFQRFRNRIV